MKINPRDAERFIKKPTEGLRAILLFGENAGLVADFAERLVRSVVPNAKDIERIVDIPADQLRKDPARLADEAAQMSMFSPGRRVLRIADATDGLAPIFADVLAANGPGDALILVEAGDLTARAALRQVFEAAPNAAALACYDDTPDTIQDLAAGLLKEMQATASPEALAALIGRLGLDRRVIRAELHKLEIYFGPTTTKDPRVVTLDLVAELFGQSGAVEADDVATALAHGDTAKLDALLLRAEEAGASATHLVTMALRHLHALLAAKAHGSSEDVVNIARQRGLWGQSETAIRSQLRLWSPERLTAALRVLGQAEADTRTTGLPDWPIAGRALLHAARLAG